MLGMGNSIIMLQGFFVSKHGQVDGDTLCSMYSYIYCTVYKGNEFTVIRHKFCPGLGNKVLCLGGLVERHICTVTLVC